MKRKIASHIAILIIACGATFRWRLFMLTSRDASSRSESSSDMMHTNHDSAQLHPTTFPEAAAEHENTVMKAFEWPTSHAHLIPIDPMLSDESWERVSDQVAALLKFTPKEHIATREVATNARNEIVGRLLKTVNRATEKDPTTSEDVWSFGGIQTADVRASLRSQFEQILGKERATLLFSINENILSRKFEIYQRIRYISVETDASGNDLIGLSADDNTMMSGTGLPGSLRGIYQPIVDTIKAKKQQ